MTKAELRCIIQEIITEVSSELMEGPRDPSIFKAIFMAGGPGAGKSYVVKQLGLDALGFRSHNSDDIYQHLIQKAGNDIPEFDIGSPIGQLMRKNASDLTNKKTKRGYLEGRLGIVFDGTGKDFRKIEVNKEKLELLGYDTLMIFVNSDIETAISRNNNRARKVPIEMVNRFWSDVQKNVGKFQSLFGQENFIVIDNSATTSSADLNKSIYKAYVRIKQWAATPARNPTAKHWLNNTP